MTRSINRFLRITLVSAAGFTGLFLGERASIWSGGSLVTTADARIGRPLTPLSYAGVARRTTRRAIAAGAYARGAAPVVVAPVPIVPGRRCVQAVDAYGRIYMRCY